MKPNYRRLTEITCRCEKHSTDGGFVMQDLMIMGLVFNLRANSIFRLRNVGCKAWKQSDDI